MSRRYQHKATFYDSVGTAFCDPIPVYQMFTSNDGWPVCERMDLRMNLSDRGVNQLLMKLVTPMALTVHIDYLGQGRNLTDILRRTYVSSVDYSVNNLDENGPPDVMISVVYSERWMSIPNGDIVRIPFSSATGREIKKPPTDKRKAALWHRDGF